MWLWVDQGAVQRSTKKRTTMVRRNTFSPFEPHRHQVAAVCRVIRWGAAATLVALVLLHPRGAGVAEYFQSSEATSCAGVTPMGAAAEMSSKLSQASGHVWTDSKATQADQAVVFRGFQASKAQVDRVLGLAAALKEVKGASLDVWVSLDNTHAHNATHMFITEIKGFKPRLLLGRDLKLHQYTEKVSSLTSSTPRHPPNNSPNPVLFA